MLALRSIPQLKTHPAVLSASGISKSFYRGNQRADVLCNASLELQRGECAFLVGPSGSGKSTLLAILGCILTPDAGEINVLGEAVHRLGAAERTRFRRDHLGFVFQKFHLLRGLTALENVCLPLTLQGVSEQEARRRATEMLDAVGLAEHVHSDPRRMSGGQCQRVAIARALASDAEILLADEPTAALDEANGQQVMELLTRLVRERHCSALVVTHDPRIFSFADRIWQIAEGRVQEQVAKVRPHRGGGQ